MEHYLQVNTNISEEEEENCINIFRSIMHSHHALLNIGSEVAGKFKLHIAELNVIDMLGTYGPLTMGKLSQTTFVSPSNTTRTVKKLEEMGLVTRQRSTVSERVVNVELTKQGQKLYRNTYPSILQAVQHKLETLFKPSERKTLAKLLQRFET